jgi:hypothetical protein
MSRLCRFIGFAAVVVALLVMAAPALGTYRSRGASALEPAIAWMSIAPPADLPEIEAH